MSTVKITDAAGNKPVFTQWDVDRILYISGVSSQPCLHFANAELIRALVVDAEETGGKWMCRVPNFVLQFAGPMVISVYIQPDEGLTVAQIPVNVRPKLKPQDYTYEENIGYVNWVQKSAEVQELIDTIQTMLDDGELNGFSPLVAVTDISGGHRVSITDADGTHSFDVMDGSGATRSSIIDLRSKVNGELTSANIAQAILDALEDGSIIYIPAGDYTFNVTITQDCTIIMDDECYISTASQTPCISASNCSISIYGGNIYSGADVDYSTLTADDDRRKPLGWGASIQRGEQSIIRLMNCHDCTIKGVNSPWHNSLFAIFASNCRSLVIESCSFDKILRSAIFLDGHCEKVAIRNCVFKNSRYAVDSSGNPQYWCYFVYTGVWSNSDLVTPPDGLIFESNYCEHSEDCGLDTHGASNVIMRNNTVLDTVCALTAYNDNARIVRPAGWCMENVLIESNYCSTSRSNNPQTDYPHPFIFLGASNYHSATDTGYETNPGTHDAFRNCVVRNNTFICSGAHDGSVKPFDLFAVSFEAYAKNVSVTENVIDVGSNTYAAIGSFEYLLFARIENNSFPRNEKVDFRNGSAVMIDCGNVSIRNDVLREITWTNGLHLGSWGTSGTVISAGDDVKADDNRLARAAGYGRRVTGSYTGARAFEVNVADGVCTLEKHHFLPGMRATFLPTGGNTPSVNHIKDLLDFDNFTLLYEMADGAYTMTLSETSIENYPSSSAPAMDGTAAAGSSGAYARGDHVHPTDTSRLAADQGAQNAGKFLVVGNDGLVSPVSVASATGVNF